MLIFNAKCKQKEASKIFSLTYASTNYETARFNELQSRYYFFPQTQIQLFFSNTKIFVELSSSIRNNLYRSTPLLPIFPPPSHFSLLFESRFQGSKKSLFLFYSCLACFFKLLSVLIYFSNSFFS